MRNFEERYTAWLDGAMDAREREAFEAELPDFAAAADEAAQWGQLRDILRESVRPEPMPHGDFVNSQVLAAIRSEMPPAPRPEGAWFPIGRLAWSGAGLLAAAAVLAAVVVPNAHKKTTGEQFISQVVKERSAGKGANAYTFHTPGGNGAVLWVDDAGYIPADERIK